jgi:hypothetical protein
MICGRCGYNKCLAAIEFHHKNPSEKLFMISKKLKSNSPKGSNADAIRQEIKKCEIVCANCHREIHNG